jgi:hypothetical protein
MKLLPFATTLLALGFALSGTVHAQDLQKQKADGLKSAAVKKSNTKIVGPSDKSSTDTPSGKSKPSVKPVPKPNTAATKSNAAMGQGGAVMMKEKSEPPPKDPKGEPTGGGGSPKDPKPKKAMMMKDKAAMKLSPGQSQQ